MRFPNPLRAMTSSSAVQQLSSQPGVDITNVLRAPFSYKSLFSSYVSALNELSYKKHERKTLMKLSTGVDFTNVLQAVLICMKNPKAQKSSVPFCIFGICNRKICL